MTAVAPVHSPGKTDVRRLLDAFAPITLQEMDRVRLMDRTDTKFVLHAESLPVVLARLREHYSALEVEGTRVSRYETLYYDTDEFGLYTDHHSGKGTRCKVRARKYVESDYCVFEVKHKNNKGRTIKKRIRTDRINAIPCEASSKLLTDLTDIDPRQLKGRIWVDYGRITLVSRESAERVTLDVDLRYRVDDRAIDMGQLAIAEVKRDQASSESAIIKVFRDLRIKEGSLSKYCLGLVLAGANVRTNNFKEQVRFLRNFTHVP